MTIQIELSPEVEARLVNEAELRGMAPATYAGSLLREALASHGGGSGRLTVEEVREMLSAIAKGSEHLPKVPTSSFSRESFYEDRL